jgi:hypothetical protein
MPAPRKKIRPYTEDEADQLALSNCTSEDEIRRYLRRMSGSFSGRRKPRAPVKSADGTLDRIEEQAQRIEAGEDLHHEADPTLSDRVIHAPKFEEGIKPRNGVKTMSFFEEAEEDWLSAEEEAKLSWGDQQAQMDRVNRFYHVKTSWEFKVRRRLGLERASDLDLIDPNYDPDKPRGARQ